MRKLLVVIAVLRSCAAQDSPNTINCKPKPGCHIAQCDPAPVRWGDKDLDRYLHRNEYPITCEASGTNGNVSAELSRLEDEVKEALAELKREEENEKQRLDAKIALSERRIQRTSLKDTLDEIGKAKFEMEKYTQDQIEIVKKKMRQEIKNRLEQMNKTQTANFVHLEKTCDSKIEKAIQNLQTELQGDISEMEARLTAFVKTSIESKLGKEPKGKGKEPQKATPTPTSRTVATVKTPTVARNVPQPQGGEYSMTFGGSRFWLEAKSWLRYTYDDALAACKNGGGNLANIYSEEHYSAIEDYIRREMPSVNNNIAVWVGMDFDALNNNLHLNDGSLVQFSKWFPSYPDVGSAFDDRTKLYLYIQRSAESKHQGMVNSSKNQGRSLQGALCEGI